MRENNKYEKILAVATNLVNRKGFNGVSLQEIADKMKLHKSSLFYYFRNKEELLLRILEKPFDEFWRNFENIVQNDQLRPEEKLKKAIENHLTLLIQYQANSNIFLNELRCLSPKNQRMHFLSKIKSYEKGFENIITEMKRDGYFDGEDPRLVTFGILGMLNWVIRWFRRDGRLTINQICDGFYQMITRR